MDLEGPLTVPRDGAARIPPFEGVIRPPTWFFQTARPFQHCVLVIGAVLVLAAVGKSNAQRIPGSVDHTARAMLAA